MAKHPPHTSPSGRHKWTQEGGHCACAQNHHLTPQGDDCPHMLPNVVLRCRCDDPLSHASKNEHCPLAEIDVEDSYTVSEDFTPVVTQQEA